MILATTRGLLPTCTNPRPVSVASTARAKRCVTIVTSAGCVAMSRPLLSAASLRFGSPNTRAARHECGSGGAGQGTEAPLGEADSGG
ncbi:unnamed protein product [Lampetra fluviatilis]